MGLQSQQILIVEDELRIRNLLRLYLEREGFEVDEATTGEIGLEKALRYDYDLLILDVMLPSMDGFFVTSRIRQYKTTPILILTAKDSEEDVIQGFESGADDYVTKPFSPREVVHRIRSVVRRRQAGNHENLTFHRRLKLRDFILEDDHKLSSRGKEIHLTPKEYELLFYLATSPDKLFSRENILQNVWNYDYSVDYRTVDTHIKRVREKLDYISAGSSSMIKTIWGLGYKFKID
ncbi:response regulator transcription factor [Paenibacillus polysaccharolyticus]|uniref:response regulator transcription factor n=1 Tax=Paenibacillus polysaccharolyticus TaxID=582692 RepID=UPI00209DA745|nr:response regulator transcription factor [Paenibacillus polysaccharolyticus]MCP1133997.1 response regulator transcription factor [Paenibacillus polysaccharolyticus]